jgi:hypothetical protein
VGDFAQRLPNQPTWSTPSTLTNLRAGTEISLNEGSFPEEPGQ